jgi:hypothetical protein
VQSKFQLRCSVYVCCGVLNDQLFGLFIFEGRLKREMYLWFLQEELLQPFYLGGGGCLSINNIVKYAGTPPFSREIRYLQNERFPGRKIGRGGPHNWPATPTDLNPGDCCVWGWLKKNVLRLKGWNARRTVRSHCGCGRPLQGHSSGSWNEQRALFTTDGRGALRLGIGVGFYKIRVNLI